MHGGIGMTDEYDIGLYMKRDRVLNELFGDANYHADKLARMKGITSPGMADSPLRHCERAKQSSCRCP
jgi:hypothetical protein